MADPSDGADLFAASDTSLSYSREKISLCCEIILDHFGPVAAQVASTLLQRGRLTLRELSRFLATPTLHAPTGYIPDQDDATAQGEMLQESGHVPGGSGRSAASTSATTWTTPLRSQRLIQQTLLTLIQHNICWHACVQPDGTLVTAAIDNSTGLADAYRGVEYFQINAEEVLARLRIGSYLSLARKEFGPVGASIVAEVSHHGKLRVSDIVERVSSRNGYDMQDVQDATRDLLFYAYLQPSLAKAHSSPRDRRIGYEAEQVMQTRTMLTPRAKQQISEKARQRLADDDHEIWFTNKREDQGVRRGLLRASAKPPGKKRRVVTNGKTGDMVNGKKSKGSDGKAHSIAAHMLDGLEDDVIGTDNDDVRPQIFDADASQFVRVNFDRFDVHLRNEIVVQAVKSRYNVYLADLVKAMLQSSKGDYNMILRTRENHSQAFMTKALVSRLPNDFTLKRAFDRDALRAHTKSNKPPSDIALLEEALSILLRQGDDSMEASAKRFLGPADPDDPKEGLGGFAKVRIEFRNAARTVRQELLRKVVAEHFGVQGVRIMSLLRTLGKLDEDQIGKVCLMPMSATRDVCARMFAAGLLSLQEVPKTTDRTAMRCFYLWYIDERKCNAWLSDRLCKTLSRLAQRRRHELAREADLLAKVNRVDVGADEHLLRDVDRIRLQRVRQVVETFTLAELRTWKDLFVVSNLPE